MPPGNAPKGLGDVSHLFLSGAEPRDQPEKGTIEAVVHLASIGASFCRAYLASGTAAALAREGDSRVTILESGSSLPNVGYYFALEPGEYLSLTLGGVKSITGLRGESIRFSCAAGPGDLSLAGARFPAAARSHVIVNAFDSEALAAGGSMPPGLLGAWRAGSLHKKGSDPGLHALVLFCDEATAVAAREVPASFRRSFPGAAVFLPAGAGTAPRVAAGSGASGVEYFELPAGRLPGLARRVPPGDPFFQGLASRMLRILGSMSRRGKADAVAG